MSENTRAMRLGVLAIGVMLLAGCDTVPGDSDGWPTKKRAAIVRIDENERSVVDDRGLPPLPEIPAGSAEGLIGAPTWWHSKPRVVEGELSVCATATGEDLLKARKTAVSLASKQFREYAGHEPSGEKILVDSARMRDGKYRAFVQLSAIRHMAQVEEDESKPSRE